MEQLGITEIDEKEFNQNKGFSKRNWNKTKIKELSENLVNNHSGKILMLDISKIYNSLRLDNGLKVVKYPSYNLMLELKKQEVLSGFDMKTVGNVKNEVVGGIKIDLR